MLCMDISREKTLLRRKMRLVRKSIDAEKRMHDEEALQNRLLSLSAIKRVKCIAVYNPCKSEARFVTDFEQLYQLEQGPTIAFPLVHSKTGMAFFRFEASDDRSILAQPSKIIESYDADKYIKPEQIDVMLIPGIAFDEQGHRLGQGGGYYDRYLPFVRKDCMLIGVAFDEQIIESVPFANEDASVDYIITPSRLISAR